MKSIEQELQAALHAERDRLKKANVQWDVADVMNVIMPFFLPAPDTDIYEDSPVHRWFCLSYCSYAVFPRSILQSMPIVWQRRFVRLMEQMGVLCSRANVSTPDYHVHGRDGNRYVSDPYRDYERGRRDVFKEAGR